MEAMFAGAVAVLPRSFEAVFGDAAVYAQPDDVQTVIAACYRDWTLFQAQSERGLDYVLENCTAAPHRRRLARLGVDIASYGVRLGIANESNDANDRNRA